MQVRAGNEPALAGLMAWAVEALTLLTHHLHGLGLDRALQLLEVPRHEITVSAIVARKIELAYRLDEPQIGRDD